MKPSAARKRGGPELLAVEGGGTPAMGQGEVHIRARLGQFLDLLMIQKRYQIQPPPPFHAWCRSGGRGTGCGRGRHT